MERVCMQETFTHAAQLERADIMHPFEQALSVLDEDIEFELRGHFPSPWADFLLNPRRLRGSDFLMRWSQGQWSEDRMIQAVNSTDRYFALAYGPSGVAPDNDVRAFELYFERLEAAGLGRLKRPDLLIFRKPDELEIQVLIDRLGGLQELPFIPEEHPDMIKLLEYAIVAIECENSLWIAKQMPNFGTPLTPQKRLKGNDGLKKTAVVPTVIVKEEDRPPLREWQAERGVPIHIWHAFYDLAYGIAFDTVEKLITEGKIETTIQTFQAPGGATSQKPIYKIYYHHAYPLGEGITEPTLQSAFVVDKNGHILPYVKFEGGDLRIFSEAIDVLDKLANGIEIC